MYFKNNSINFKYLIAFENDRLLQLQKMIPENQGGVNHYITKHRDWFSSNVIACSHLSPPH